MRAFFEVEEDAYTEATRNQNEGHTCKDCNSPSGHYRICPLINRNAAEAASAGKGTINTPDQHQLKSLGVIWS